MRLFFLGVFIAVYSYCYTQTTNKGQPVSWTWLTTKQKIDAIELPSIDIRAIKSEDDKNDAISGKPWRYGIQRTVNYGLGKGGYWTDLENGDRIWRILFYSPGAINLSFNFNEFYVPSGASLYLYNDTKSDLLGAYTSQVNNESKRLGTWFVKGDKVWLEYYEPLEVKGKGILSISSLIHGYRLGNQFQKNYLPQTKGLNDSGDCNHDVDCPIGTDFETQKDLLKKSVAFLSMGNGFICSGALVNNTSEDKTPYFLTANHCFFDGNNNPSDPALYSMRFNWISPNPVCGTTSSSDDSTTNFTMNGSVLRARTEGSDHMLVEINNPIPDEWGLTYSGWDRTDTDPVFEVGIHHPSGDIMKVCRDDTGATKANAGGTAVWLIGGVSEGTGNGWEIGVTEGGSSGSPLFNENGHIIGELFAGQAACNGTSNNNDFDIYGRFAVAWDEGSSANTRLRDWLDPENLNPDTLEAFGMNNEEPEPEPDQDLTFYPNPTSGLILVKGSTSETELTFEIYNLLGQNLRSGALNAGESINISTLPNNIYVVRVTDLKSNETLTKKVILSK